MQLRMPEPAGLELGAGSYSWPKPEPSAPLQTARWTWSSRSAPRRDQRICCDLAMRRLTRKLAVHAVFASDQRRSGPGNRAERDQGSALNTRTPSAPVV
jgi:hypothetical protein